MRRGRRRAGCGRAAQWRRKAAEQGHANAQNVLGVMYFKAPASRGISRRRSTGGARRRRREIAAAIENLGVVYSAGRGVDRDPAQAVEWWRKAADPAISARSTTSPTRTRGKGVDHDPRRGGALVAQVGRSRRPQGAHALALAYHDGTGVPQDLVECYKWLYIAAARTAGDDQRVHVNARDAGFGTTITG